jgi:hypothetical protein
MAVATVKGVSCIYGCFVVLTVFITTCSYSVLQGFVLAEIKSKEKVLVKYFGENDLKDWKREVAVQTKLKQCGRSNDNVMTYKWNADSGTTKP